MGYDEWLEKPYTDQAKRDALYEKFCEDHELVLDDEDSEDLFQEWLDAHEEAE